VSLKGEHWKLLGFNTDDPSAELKCGLLSLWLMFSLHRHDSEMAEMILQDSKSEGSEFDFAQICDMAAERTVLSLRRGRLDSIFGSKSFSNHRFIDIVKHLFVGFIYK